MDWPPGPFYSEAPNIYCASRRNCRYIRKVRETPAPSFARSESRGMESRRRPRLPPQAGGGMAFCEARQLDRRDDQTFRDDAAGPRSGLRLHAVEAREAPGLPRHDAETALGIAFRRLHRERAHPRLARSLRRALRPVHALPFNPGRLRLWLQVLRERARGLETEPHRR